MKSVKSKKILFVCTICLVLIFCLIVRHIYNGTQCFYINEYPYKDISKLIRTNNLSEDDYRTIFMQTGISPGAAKKIIHNKDFEFLEVLNKKFFQKNETYKNYIAYPITLEERRKDDKVPMVELKKGDILVTFSTHTLDWRHGHCGLVVDEWGTRVLEHASVGKKSNVVSSGHWRTYGNFVVLRYPDEEIASKAADYAQDNLVGIDYSIFAGLLDKDKSDNLKDSTSHCSHIVWQAYKALGVDIDYNEGSIVTPRDIAMSDKLKVVQVLGMNVENFNDRLYK